MWLSVNGTPPQAALADRQSRTGPRYMLPLLIPVSKKERKMSDKLPVILPLAALQSRLDYGHGIIQREKAVIPKTSSQFQCKADLF